MLTRVLFSIGVMLLLLGVALALGFLAPPTSRFDVQDFIRGEDIASPTLPPPVSPSPTPLPPQVITIETPQAGTPVGSPVSSTTGRATSFNATLSFVEPRGGGTITVEIYDQNGAAGAAIATASISMYVAPAQLTVTPTSLPHLYIVGLTWARCLPISIAGAPEEDEAWGGVSIACSALQGETARRKQLAVWLMSTYREVIAPLAIAGAAPTLVDEHILPYTGKNAYSMGWKLAAASHHIGSSDFPVDVAG
jgi:hypothetical protein